MNYSDTLSWMFVQLPMYQNKGKKAYKKDLSNTLLLAKHLNNPENLFRSIHVAGTNGKGSTCHMLASILQEAGYSVGLYTSPHLKDFRERIKINGQCISKQFVISFIKRNKPFFEEHQLSFFEMTVGMAFEYFAKKKVDIAIIETGLGGRLDSTNIIKPMVSVITNIGYDHMDFLGNSLKEIASEKAGIIKEKTPVVIGEKNPETESIFNRRARELEAPITFAEDIETDSYQTDLRGNYQLKNIHTAIATLNKLPNDYIITKHALTEGLKNITRNTGLFGRWQVLKNKPLIVCDTAHNAEGLEITMNQVHQQSYNKLHLVLGFVNDKDLGKIINLFPEDAIYYFCKPNVQRGMPVKKVVEIFNNNGRSGFSFRGVQEAYTTAKKSAKDDDMIYVGGSTFVVAEVV